MSDNQRKAVYAVVVAIGGVLVAFGVWDGATESAVEGVVSALLGVVNVLGGLVAHRHVSTPPSAVGSAEPSDADAAVLSAPASE